MGKTWPHSRVSSDSGVEDIREANGEMGLGRDEAIELIRWGSSLQISKKELHNALFLEELSKYIPCLSCFVSMNF